MSWPEAFGGVTYGGCPACGRPKCVARACCVNEQETRDAIGEVVARVVHRTNPPAINYFVLQEYAQKHRLDLNELSRVVRDAVRPMPDSPPSEAKQQSKKDGPL